MDYELDKLTIRIYPDPVLRKKSQPVTAFDERLAALARRMLELMREARGVGLAAPQVGLPIRLFVMNPTGKEGDDQVYLNPELLDPQGGKEDEEGCLSIPDVRVQVRRATRIRLRAQDLGGKPVELDGEQFIARIWQHETDHLNGVLILDRMGPGDKLATRKALRELEQRAAAPSPSEPPQTDQP